MKQWIESAGGSEWVLPPLPRGRAWKVTGEVRVDGPRSWLEVEEVDAVDGEQTRKEDAP